MNLTSIYSTNLLGCLLMIAMLVGNRWRFKEHGLFNKLILLLLFGIMLCCISDPIAFTLDGKPGILNRIIIHFCCGWPYFMNILLGTSWVAIMEYQMVGKIDKFNRIVIHSVLTIGTLLMIVNFFTPIVFKVDENNVYSRGPLYLLFISLVVFLMFDTVIVYIIIHRRGKLLKFFPIWTYVFPLTIGMVVQSMYYGVSLIWPCAAVAIAGVLSCIQNELIFRDKLTGIYNRYYLDNLKSSLNDDKNSTYAVMMIDVNDFKRINDTCGHSAGDEALVTTSKLLVNTVGNIGNVIRYAGDEFVIVINADTQDAADKIVKDIHNAFDENNRITKKPYSLTVSIGCILVNLFENNLDDVLKLVDAKMYEEKQNFYKAHPEKSRRNR